MCCSDLYSSMQDPTLVHGALHAAVCDSVAAPLQGKLVRPFLALLLAGDLNVGRKPHKMEA